MSPTKCTQSQRPWRLASVQLTAALRHHVGGTTARLASPPFVEPSHGISQQLPVSPCDQLALDDRLHFLDPLLSLWNDRRHLEEIVDFRPERPDEHVRPRRKVVVFVGVAKSPTSQAAFQSAYVWLIVPAFDDTEQTPT